MMRPWHRWMLFIISLAIVLSAMGWVSWTVLKLDRAETEARRQAAVEEEVRLALWRMDSALAPLIAQEGSYPYFAYRPFYPAERAYTRMNAEIQGGEILMPSPLLVQTQPRVIIHFQLDPLGALTSPQVPTGSMRDLAESEGYRTRQAIDAAQNQLSSLRESVPFEKLKGLLAEPQLRPAAVVTAPPQRPPRSQEPQPPPQPPGQSGQVAQAQGQRRSGQEASIRFRQQAEMQQQMVASNVQVAENASVGVGLMRPLWFGDALILARRVSVNGRESIQGSQLDWPAIRVWLLGQIQDVLPAATLEKAPNDPDARAAHRLAALPVCLVPGAVHRGDPEPVSTLRLSLGVAWSCVLIAAAAVIVLLKGAVSLSERRGAFVSAVTHELRTPLTTFRLYTEMLEQGRVATEEKRQRYLQTLRTEAERLSHLVENVLAYARLERGRTRRPLETFPLEEFITQVSPRLAGRASQAGMTWVVQDPGERAPIHVRADASALEQILLNLVDNACKYAATAPDRGIHLRIGTSGRFAEMRVQDSGPGIAAADRRSLFRPFHKSAVKAANSAPGVGLGLSLSRRLARDLGGDLRLDETVKSGACFILSVPIALEQ